MNWRILSKKVKKKTKINDNKYKTLKRSIIRYAIKIVVINNEEDFETSEWIMKIILGHQNYENNSGPQNVETATSRRKIKKGQDSRQTIINYRKRIKPNKEQDKIRDN